MTVPNLKSSRSSVSHLKLDDYYTPTIIQKYNIQPILSDNVDNIQITMTTSSLVKNADSVTKVATCQYSIAPERSTIYLTSIWITPQPSFQILGPYLLHLLCKDAQLKRFRNIIITDPSLENRRLYASVGFQYCPKTHKIYIKTQKLLHNTQFLMFINHVRETH